MADLRLISQQTHRDQIAPKINQLKTQLDLRKDIWVKVSPEKKRQWVQSGKDPIMTLAYQMYEYLHDNFFDGVK
jgi:hypothetical protein